MAFYKFAAETPSCVFCTFIVHRGKENPPLEQGPGPQLRCRHLCWNRWVPNSLSGVLGYLNFIFHINWGIIFWCDWRTGKIAWQYMLNMVSSLAYIHALLVRSPSQLYQSHFQLLGHLVSTSTQGNYNNLIYTFFPLGFSPPRGISTQYLMYSKWKCMSCLYCSPQCMQITQVTFLSKWS